MGKLDGKVAIITGSSRGIGRDIALVFGREGARVVVSARTENEGDFRIEGSIRTTVERIRAAGGQAIGVRCNVGDDLEIENLVNRTMDEWGRVDILVNNAGILIPGSILDLQPKHWDLIFRVNVRGPFVLCRTVLPHMIRQGWGHIINISSMGAVGPGAGPYTSAGDDGTPYGATKAALERFTQGLASEVWDKNVGVNVIHPVPAIVTEGGNFFRGTKTEDMKGWYPDGRSMGDAAAIVCSRDPKQFTGNIMSQTEVLRYAGVDLSQYPVVP